MINNKSDSQQVWTT